MASDDRIHYKFYAFPFVYALTQISTPHAVTYIQEVCSAIGFWLSDVYSMYVGFSAIVKQAPLGNL